MIRCLLASHCLLASMALFASTATANETIREFPGVAAGDRFGFSTASGFDLNADGLPDLAVGAPGVPKDEAGAGGTIGYLRVFSGADGALLLHRDGQQGAEFGHCVHMVGDTDADGFLDLAVGAPSHTKFPEVRNGSVSLLSGLDGSLRYELFGVESHDGFGWSIASGDLTGNGWVDFVVGAPGSDAGGVDSGAVTVVFGLTGFSLYADAVPNTPGFRAGTAVATTRGYSGFSTFDNVLVGAPNPSGNGVVRIYASGLDLQQTLTGPSGALFGASIAATGYHSPSVWSFFVGAPLAASGAGSIRAYHPAPFDTDTFFGVDGQQFGARISFLDDVDGDGFPQIMVSASGTETAGILGSDPHALPIRKFLAADGEPSIIPVGDVDQDGRPDVAVGWPEGNQGTGVVTIHHGDPQVDDAVFVTAPPCPSPSTTLDVLGCVKPGQPIEIALTTAEGADVALLVGTGSGTIPISPACHLSIAPLTPVVTIIPDAPYKLLIPLQIPVFTPTADLWMQAIVRYPVFPFPLVTNAIRVELL